MARVQSAIASFATGEVTPALLGRTDTDEYPQFLSVAENVFVEKHGGIKRRGGTLMAAPTRSQKVRLVPFIFSRTQSYVMEFGDLYVRFYKDDAPVESAGAVSTYLGDGTTTDFQFPYGIEEEPALGDGIQTVFSYTFTIDPGNSFQVWLFDGSVWTLQADPADYSHNDIAKTVTMVVAPPSGGVLSIINVSIDPADIEVYLVVDGVIPEDPVDPADYDVEPINTVNNILIPFGTPDWNPDAEDVGTPWTLPNDGSATSPVGAEPVLRETDIHMTHGAIIDAAVSIDVAVYTETQDGESNVVDLPIDGFYKDIETLSLSSVYVKDITVSFTVEDPGTGGAVSDFQWEVRHDSVIIAQGTEVGVTAPVTINPTIDELVNPQVGDAIAIYVRASSAGTLPAPQISGSFSPTSITVNYFVNPNALLYVQSRDSGVGSFKTSIRPSDLILPQIWQFASGATVDDPQPLLLEFYTDPGLEVTISSVFVRNSRSGWKISMDTPPPVGDALIIRADVQIPPGTPFEIQSPFAESELDQLYWAQANDVMIFCHYAHRPWRLTRRSEYEWIWDQPTLYGAPWDVPATTHSAAGSDATDEPLIKQFPFYFSASAKDKMEVRFNNVLQSASSWDLKSGQSFPITGQGDIVTTGTPALGVVVTISLKESGYNPAYGYPRVVVFFQERLWLGGTLISPQTLWGSRTADFYNFYVPKTQENQTLNPDDAVEYTLAAYTHEAIEWLSSERVLVIGTSSTEHRLAPDEYIATDRLPQVSKMTDYGGGHQMPMYMGGLTCFVQQSGRQLRSFEQRANMVLEEYQSTDLTWMASHMVKNLWVKEPYYALIPNNIAVMIREDGQLLTAMYDPSTGQMDIRQIAWSRHITDGTFESCCVIPTDFGHEIWVSVIRDIEGVPTNFVEVIREDFFMDCATIQVTETPTTEVTGLDYIEGKTVDIVVDGAVHPQRLVTDGMVTLLWAGLEIIVGLPYRPKVVTVPFIEGNPAGTGQGKPGRWSEIWVRMVESALPIVNGRRPRVRHPITPMNTPEPVMTGAVRVFDTGYSFDKEITIEQDLPLPMQITTVFGTFHLGTG